MCGVFMCMGVWGVYVGGGVGSVCGWVGVCGGGVECVSAIIALSYWNSSSVKNVKGPLKNYETLHLCHH